MLELVTLNCVLYYNIKAKNDCWYLFLYLSNYQLIFFQFMLMSMNSLLSSQLHFYFLSLNMFSPFNIILLFHLSLPSLKLSWVSEIHLEIFCFLLVLLFLFLEQVTLSYNSCSVYFDNSRFFIKIWHRFTMLFFELNLFTSFLLDSFFGLLQLHWTIISRECERSFSIKFRFSLLFYFFFSFDLLLLYLLQISFVYWLRNLSPLYNFWYLFRHRQRLGFRLGKVKRLWNSWSFFFPQCLIFLLILFLHEWLSASNTLYRSRLIKSCIK